MKLIVDFGTNREELQFFTVTIIPVEMKDIPFLICVSTTIAVNKIDSILDKVKLSKRMFVVIG